MKKAMIEQLVLGMVGTNTWLIKNKESNELLRVHGLKKKLTEWEEYRWRFS